MDSIDSMQVHFQIFQMGSVSSTESPGCECGKDLSMGHDFNILDDMYQPLAQTAEMFAEPQETSDSETTMHTDAIHAAAQTPN